MADEGTLCDSGAVKLKAGTNVSTALTPAHYLQLINQAESFITTTSRIAWSGAFATLDVDKQSILSDVCSSKAAMGAINFDMGGYTSKREAETMLDYNNDIVTKGLALLKEKQQTDFIQK